MNNSIKDIDTTILKSLKVKTFIVIPIYRDETIKKKNLDYTIIKRCF